MSSSWAGAPIDSPPTWAQLFDVLSAADVKRLRDLYDDPAGYSREQSSTGGTARHRSR